MKIDKYLEPTTIDEAVTLLNQEQDEVKLLAGGTDLVVRMRNRMVKPNTVISLNSIDSLVGIKETQEGLFIGAMTKLVAVSKAKELTGAWEVIAEGAGHISSLQVRNIATIGGNTCNSSPSADSVPGLVCCEAKVVITGKNGERKMPIEEFFTGPGQNALAKDEILLGFEIPKCEKGTGTAYKKFAIRGDTDIAIIGVGVKVVLGADGVITNAKICLGGVAPTPLCITDVAKLLVGKKMTDELLEEVALKASEACKPITDARATKEYRKEMVYVWTKNEIKAAIENAQANI